MDWSRLWVWQRTIWRWWFKQLKWWRYETPHSSRSWVWHLFYGGAGPSHPKGSYTLSSSWSSSLTSQHGFREYRVHEHLTTSLNQGTIVKQNEYFHNENSYSWHLGACHILPIKIQPLENLYAHHDFESSHIDTFSSNGIKCYCLDNPRICSEPNKEALY